MLENNVSKYKSFTEMRHEATVAENNKNDDIVFVAAPLFAFAMVGVYLTVCKAKEMLPSPKKEDVPKV